MYQRIAFRLFILVGLIGLTVSAQTDSLSGTITNQDGQEVANAAVHLTVAGLTTATGTNGKYSFNGVTGVLPMPVPQLQNISLEKGILVFSLPIPSSMEVEVFDIKGALLKKAQLQNASAGTYHFNIADNFRTSKLLVIKAAIGKSTATFRYTPLNAGSDVMGQSSESGAPRGCRLNTVGAIAAAVHDTLKVSAPGYLTTAVICTTYLQVLNAILDTAAGPVTVHLNSTEQTMAGFGLNDSWGTAFTAATADSFFDTTSAGGIGLTILRVGMGTNGTELSSNIYGDIALAHARGVNTFIGSTWSAPAAYKSNNNVNNGGHLLKADYTAWATTIAAFSGVVHTNTGVYLTAMSLANEPEFESCAPACPSSCGCPCSGSYATMLYTDTEMVAFAKVVGPLLHALNPPVKFIAPEPSEWIHLWRGGPGDYCGSALGSTNPMPQEYDFGHFLYWDVPASPKDTLAWAQVDIIGTHEYDTQQAEPWPSDVPFTKQLWVTEMAGVACWPEAGPSTDIVDGVVVAGWIHDAITRGRASAWCWWWDAETGGNEGLFTSTVTKRFYTLGNFSKFVRPGYTRVGVTGDSIHTLLLTAYKGPNNTVVIVAINKAHATITVPISISGGTVPASLTPYVTSATKNLAAQTAVTVNNGSFTAVLDSTTVTTFVGR